MKRKTVTVKLDAAERGAILTALIDLRNKRIAEEKSIEFLNEVIVKLYGD